MEKLNLHGVSMLSVSEITEDCCKINVDHLIMCIK